MHTSNSDEFLLVMDVTFMVRETGKRARSTLSGFSDAYKLPIAAVFALTCFADILSFPYQQPPDEMITMYFLVITVCALALMKVDCATFMEDHRKPGGKPMDMDALTALGVTPVSGEGPGD